VVAQDILASCFSSGGLVCNSLLGSVDTLAESLDSDEDFTSGADGFIVDFVIENVNVLVVVVDESLSKFSDTSGLVFVQLWVDKGWESSSINDWIVRSNNVVSLSESNSSESSGNESSHGKV